MPRRAVPQFLSAKNLVAALDDSGVPTKWFCYLPSGLPVFVGRTEEEALDNLTTLNRLAALCHNKWRGVDDLIIR